MTAALVLAAGASTRLGEPKQLLAIGGETLLERAVRVAREAGCAPVVVVLGAAADSIRERCQLGDAVIAVNADWRSGMASSIRSGLEQFHHSCGVRRMGAMRFSLRENRAQCVRPGDTHCGTALAATDGVDGAVLMTCDQPAVTAAHLRLLMATGAVTASAYAGRRGVPAYFPAASFPELLRLTGDAGARELLRGAAAVELPGGEVDIDTAADRAEAKRRFG